MTGRIWFIKPLMGNTKRSFEKWKSATKKDNRFWLVRSPLRRLNWFQTSWKRLALSTIFWTQRTTLKKLKSFWNAGQKGAVTIATNMAGRGTDIKLGDGVKELGGLAVIGTERHESRRMITSFVDVGSSRRSRCLSVLPFHGRWIDAPFRIRQ